MLPSTPQRENGVVALAIDGYTEDMLTDTQRATGRRIVGEPGSLAMPGAVLAGSGPDVTAPAIALHAGVVF